MTDQPTPPPAAGAALAPPAAAVATRAPGGPSLGSILTIAGAVLLIAALFLPWWSANVNSGRRSVEELDDLEDAFEDSPKIIIELADATVYNLDWYVYHLTPQMIAESLYENFREPLIEMIEYKKARRSGGRWDEPRSRMDRPDRAERPKPPRLDATVRLAGWRTATGAGALVVSLLALSLLVVAALAPVLKPWLWIGQMVLACVVVLLLLFAILFAITCPGADVEMGRVLEFSQGVSYGLFVELAGLALLLVGLGAAFLHGAQRIQQLLGASKTPEA